MTIQEIPMYHSLSLGHAEAPLAIQSIQAELLQRGKTAVIAVADAHGELIGLLHMDGAPLPPIQRSCHHGQSEIVYTCSEELNLLL
jgi:uncharacterized protein GlcG (DUF336 family)